MVEFDRIKDMIYREISEIENQGNLTMDCVHALGEMVDILKDISEIEAMDDYSRDGYSNNSGYSNNGYSQRGSRYNMRYYDTGNSYGGSYRGSMRGGYSREDGRLHMINNLEKMMNEAQNENDRMEIQRLVDKMKNS